jgi:uncharacterized protein
VRAGRRPPGPDLTACCLLALAVIGVAGEVAAKDVPFLAGRVNDYAAMIPQKVQDAITATLTDLEKKTGAQVAVLTVDSLDGEPLEDYSMKVAETWKLGQKGKDNGVLILVAKADRKMRIEVGYGLEPTLTDAKCSMIINNVMRPRFRQGDFGGGLEAAAQAIAGTIEGKNVIPEHAPQSGQQISDAPLGFKLFGLLIFTVVIGTFSLHALFSKGASSWFLYVFLMLFYLVFPMALLGVGIGTLVFLGWIFGFPVAKHWLHGTSHGKAFMKGHPKWVSFATSSGHGGSGGGFSGGGGSFGGGGASGSW